MMFLPKSINREKFTKNLLIFLSFFAIYIFWGSTYLLNKITLSELPPFMLASIRFLIAGSLLFLIAKFLGHNLLITKKQLKNSFISGFLFLTYGNGVFVWALNYMDSGIAALEASTQPLVILLLMYIFYKKKLKLKSIIGVALGVLGIYLLVSQNQILNQENSLLAIIVVFTCVVSWSAGSLFVAKANLPSSFIVSTGYQMFLGGIMLLSISLLLNETWTSPTQWSTKIIFSLTGLITLGSIAAFTAFNYLLKKVSTEKVATSAYVNPVVALFLGWYFLDEQLTLQSITAATILLLGVYFINTKKES